MNEIHILLLFRIRNYLKYNLNLEASHYRVNCSRLFE